MPVAKKTITVRIPADLKMLMNLSAIRTESTIEEWIADAIRIKLGKETKNAK